jgi:hypothetical protein
MVKGAALRDFFAWYQEKNGLARVREMALRMPEDLRALLDPDEPFTTILAASWYPSRLVHAILDRVGEGLSEDELRVMLRDANRFVVKRNMNGVYRLFLSKLVTPEMYALAVPRLWGQLHTTGARRMTITSERSAESVVARWPGHHPILCTCTIETMCAIFETMGKREVAWERTACVSRGAKECVTILRWT